MQIPAGLGLDPIRLKFGLRTALACFLAIVLATALGLEHPQWSGMTVWVASQPIRGHLLEKSFFRLAGTLLGTLAGVALLVFSQGSVPVLVLGLAVWCGLCVGLGNIQRGFVSYGTIVAGYSAAMVALLGSAHPENIALLGADRFFTVLVGVVVAFLVGWFGGARSPDQQLLTRLYGVCACVFRLAANASSGVPLSSQEQLVVLTRIAQIDEALDSYGAGSVRARRNARACRAVVSALVSVVLWLAAGRPVRPDAALAARLARLGNAFESGGQARALLQEITAFNAAIVAPRPFRVVTGALLAVSRQFAPPLPVTPRKSGACLRVVLHRDWVGARQATIRAVAAMLLVGALWWLTGWHVVTYMLLGTSVMITLFSTFENPAGIMFHVALGQVLGVTAAMVCRWLVWPLAASQWQLVLFMPPFIVVGAFLYAHKRTAAGSFDYSMAMLLLLHPGYPLAGTGSESAALGLAVLFAPFFALLAYTLVFPTNAQRRMNAVRRMMVHDLQRMASSALKARRRRIWRVRFYHRLTKLTLWADRSGAPSSLVDGAVNLLRVGQAIASAHGLARRPQLPMRTRRRAGVLLQRMQQLEAQPQRVVLASRRLAAELAGIAPRQAALFSAVGTNLEKHLGFFTAAD